MQLKSTVTSHYERLLYKYDRFVVRDIAVLCLNAVYHIRPL